MKKVEVNETEVKETAASNWKDEALCLPASFRDIVAAADEGKGFTTEDLGLLVKALVQNDADGLTGMLRIVAITLLKEMRTMAAAHKRKREKNRERQRAHRMSRSVTPCHAQNREEKNREGETRKDINNNTDNNNNTKQKQTEDVDDDVKKAQKTSSSSSSVDVGCKRWDSKIDWKKVEVSDDAIAYSNYPVLIAAKITGDFSVLARKSWLKWIRDRGDEKFRAALQQFRSELVAGEEPHNRAATFTALLNRWRESA